MKKLLGVGLLVGSLALAFATRGGIARAITPSVYEFDYNFKTLDNSMQQEKWATDNFASHIKFTQEGESDCYKYERTDGGTFETLGTKSPGGNGITTVAAGVKGTVTGKLEGHICGTFKEGITNSTPEDLTVGSYPSYQEKYFHHFFTNIHGFNITDWGWIFTSCGNGTWTDNDATEAAWNHDGPNVAMGDITGTPAACQNPAPASQSNGGGSSNNSPAPRNPDWGCPNIKPGKVGGVFVDQGIANDGKVEVRWWPAPGATKAHIAYSEYGQPWHYALLNTANDGHEEIGFLKNNTRYYFQVAGVEGCAVGDYSAPFDPKP